MWNLYQLDLWPIHVHLTWAWLLMLKRRPLKTWKWLWMLWRILLSFHRETLENSWPSLGCIYLGINLDMGCNLNKKRAKPSFDRSIFWPDPKIFFWPDLIKKEKFGFFGENFSILGLIRKRLTYPNLKQPTKSYFTQSGSTNFWPKAISRLNPHP